MLLIFVVRDVCLFSLVLAVSLRSTLVPGLHVSWCCSLLLYVVVGTGRVVSCEDQIEKGNEENKKLDCRNDGASVRRRIV